MLGDVPALLTDTSRSSPQPLDRALKQATTPSSPILSIRISNHSPFILLIISAT